MLSGPTRVTGIPFAKTSPLPAAIESPQDIGSPILHNAGILIFPFNYSSIYKYYTKGEIDMDIDRFRQMYVTLAEMLDAFRIFPRLLVAGYTVLLYVVVRWYMDLETFMLPGCESEVVTQCIVESPTNQHAVLVTAVIGISAAIFGLYTTSGKKWNGFTFWNKKKDPAE